MIRSRAQGRGWVAATAVALAALLVPALATAQLLVGPAVGLEPSSTLVPAEGTQENPAIAFGADVFLAAWWDERAWPGSSSSPKALYAQRVGPDGALLAPPAVPIAEDFEGGGRQTVAVAFGAQVFLVAWSQSDGTVRAVRFDAGGVRLDSRPLVLGTGACREPSVAFDGERFVVAFACAVPSQCRDVRGASIDLDGRVQPLTGVASQADDFSARIACAGPLQNGGCLVAWMQSEDCDEWSQSPQLFAARLSPVAGVERSTLVTSTGSRRQPPALTVAGDAGFFAAWIPESSSYATSGALLGRFIAHDGSLSPADGGLPVTSAALLNDSDGLAAAWDGAAALVAYRGPYPAYSLTLARVDTGAGGPSAAAATAERSWGDLALAWGGQSGLLAWQAYTTDGYSLRFGVVSRNTSLSPSAPLALAAEPEDSPALAPGGNGETLIVWERRTDAGAKDLFMTRVAADGGLSSPRGEPLTVTPGDQSAPAVTAAGDGWLVAWIDEGRSPKQVYYRLVASGGAPAGTEATPLAPSPGHQNGVHAASLDDGTALVVYAEKPATPGFVLRGKRITPTGQTLDATPLDIATLASLDDRADVAASDGGFLVAYAVDSTRTVHTRFVASSGALSDAGAWVANARLQSAPAVACREDGCLVTWIDGVADTVWAAPTDSTGTPLLGAPVLVSASGGALDVPAVAPFTGGYLVTWVDERSRARRQLYGARVRADGTVLDPTGVDLASAVPGNVRSPALAALGDSRVLAAYAAFDPAPAVGAYRLQLAPISVAGAGLFLDGGAGQPPLSPGFELDVRATVACRDTLRVPSKGQPQPRGPGPVDWSIEPEPGGALPPDLTVDPATGVVTWDPAPRTPTTARFALVARGAGWTDRQVLVVDVRCQDASFSACGCATASVAPTITGLMALAAALGALRRRRPRGDAHHRRATRGRDVAARR